MTKTDFAGRRLLLEGTYNLRHVGGYKTTSGEVTKDCALFRSDSLHQLNQRGQCRLGSLGINTIIDLRHETEVMEAPNVFAQSSAINFLHRPFTYDNWVVVMDDYPPSQSLAYLYRLMLDHSQEMLRDVIAAAAQPGTFPLLIHCKIGKDRTGLVMAMLLSIAGVSPAIIAADYAQSEANLQPLYPTIIAEAEANRYDMTVFRAMMPSPHELMLETLDYLARKYGGVLPYLHAIGITEEQMASIREQLVG